MPVTHNVTNRGTGSGVSVISFNTTVGAGDNLAALIGITWEALDVDVFTDTVTFAGLPATFIQLVQNAAGSCEQYLAVGFVAGSRNCTVTWFGPGTIIGCVGLEVMNDVVQATPIGAKGTNHGDPTAGPCTVALVGTVDGSMIVDTIIVNESSLTSVTLDPSQTIRWNLNTGPSPTRHFNGGSTKSGSGGAISMQWTLGASCNWDLAAVEFLFQSSTPPVGIGGYTSYTYGDDPTPLESLRPPEEMQRVWVNDRRYMQGRP